MPARARRSRTRWFARITAARTLSSGAITYDAQYIFDEFEPEELEIQPLKFDHAFYSPTVGGMGTAKTLPEDAEKMTLSGTKVRQMLLDGQVPPPEFTRPEIAKVLIEAMKANA
jgi:sulfate adenylyltransferase